MPYRVAPQDEPTAAMPRDVAAPWSLMGLACFFAPTWSLWFACGLALEPRRPLLVAAVAALVAAIAAMPFAIGLLWALRGGNAARAHVVCALVAWLAGSAATRSVDLILAFAFYAILFSLPALALRSWQNRVRGSTMAGQIRGLGFLANVGLAFSLVALAPAAFAGALGVGTSVLVVSAFALASSRLRREREAYGRRFRAWLDEVREHRHPGYAIVPATDYRDTISWLGIETHAALLYSEEAEWLMECGQPIMRIGPPAPRRESLVGRPAG